MSAIVQAPVPGRFSYRFLMVSPTILSP